MNEFYCRGNCSSCSEVNGYIYKCNDMNNIIGNIYKKEGYLIFFEYSFSSIILLSFFKLNFILFTKS